VDADRPEQRLDKRDDEPSGAIATSSALVNEIPKNASSVAAPTTRAPAAMNPKTTPSRRHPSASASSVMTATPIARNKPLDPSAFISVSNEVARAYGSEIANAANAKVTAGMGDIPRRLARMYDKSTTSNAAITPNAAPNVSEKRSSSVPRAWVAMK
jgi:hypothetical protein